MAGAAPAVPAGTYYVYDTTSEFVHVGDVVTVDRSTITPTVTNRRQRDSNKVMRQMRLTVVKLHADLST